jgi:hypothetical protein
VEEIKKEVAVEKKVTPEENKGDTARLASGSSPSYKPSVRKAQTSSLDKDGGF